jgi:hypothetical protein
MKMPLLLNNNVRIGMLIFFFMQITGAFGQNCSKTSVGLTPLDQLGTGLYNGFSGGLYPAGSNERPPAHNAAGVGIANAIVPLDTMGRVDMVRGRIVLLSIGMSNTTMEFSKFKTIADTIKAKNPALVIVDGAQGGQTAAIISKDTANFWKVVNQRLQSAGVGPKQVQVAWVKEADAQPSSQFPVYPQTLEAELTVIMHILANLFPNIKIAYLSNRIYGGYATSTLNPEPYAYQSGFAVKWLIEKQINGDTTLPYSGAAIRSPWLAWGPNLWADGLTPDNGLTWECVDFSAADGTHPAASGQLKVAQKLLAFFQSDTTSIPWFIAGTPTVAKMVEARRTIRSGGSSFIEISTGMEPGHLTSGKRPIYDLYGRRVGPRSSPGIIVCRRMKHDKN